MISYLKGRIIFKGEGFVFVEVSGVGYEVWLSEGAIQKIPETDGAAELFCYLDVGERSLRLFGFLTFEELELFKIIRNIQGVGPKAALEISAIGSLEKVQRELGKGDGKFLNNIPGIGPKRASKIILELSGQLKAATAAAVAVKKEKDPLEDDEAFLALLNLGFPKEKIKPALAGLSKELSVQEKVKQALKLMGYNCELTAKI